MGVMLAAVAAAQVGWWAGRRFESLPAAVIAAAFFLATPLLWSAVASESPYLALMIAAMTWLIAMREYLVRPGLAWLAVAAAGPAAMMYLHPAGVVMALACIAIAMVAIAGRSPRHAAALALGGLALLAPWLVINAADPERIAAVVRAHALYDADRFTVLQGLREMTSWVGLTVRVEAYWDSLNPALLFLGDNGLWSSLARPRVFLLPVIVPFAAGLLRYVRGQASTADWIVLGMLLLAPLVSAVAGTRPVAARLLLMVPAVAIIATAPLVRSTAGWSPPALR